MNPLEYLKFSGMVTDDEDKLHFKNHLLEIVDKIEEYKVNQEQASAIEGEVSV
jgi:hypothetical protein